STVDTRTDTRGRKQPARKATVTKQPTREPVAAVEPKAKKATKLERELDAGAFHRLVIERESNADLAEKLRAAESELIGLRSENDELRTERDQLRARVAELEGAHAINDGIPDCLRRTPKAAAR